MKSLPLLLIGSIVYNILTFFSTKNDEQLYLALYVIIFLFISFIIDIILPKLLK